MKLLLTSNGITNSSIASSLDKLLIKPKEEIKIGLIPTAANVEEGNKDWFLEQFTDLHNFGFTNIDIVDISAADVQWKERLEKVDIIYVSGGNTFHLLNQVRRTGFDTWLKENLDNKVYVGTSAGSIIITPTIAIAGVEPGDINLPHITDLTGLGVVHFEISPHTPEMVTYENATKYADITSNEFYCIDDQTAIEIVYDTVRVISEGTWKKIK